MTLTTALLFCVVAWAAIATPGPTMLLALSNGARVGVRGAVPGMAGAVLSDFVLVGAVALGLGALLAASEFWFSVLKWTGALYLAWIGLRMLRSPGGPAVLPRSPGPGGPASAGGPAALDGRQLFGKAFLVAVTNPKGYLFCSALLPQFVDPGAAQAPQYLTLALLFAGLDLLMMLAYAFVGANALRWLRASAMRWLDRACGAMLLVLAGSLAFYRRASAG